MDRTPCNQGATRQDVLDAHAAARRRTDRFFSALFLALLGVVAGTGWWMLWESDQDFLRACEVMQQRDRVGVETARDAAAKARLEAVLHHEQGRPQLAVAAEKSAVSQDRLADARAMFAAQPCRDIYPERTQE